MVNIHEKLNISSSSPLLSFWKIICKDWMWLLLGAILSFMLASILLSGWPTGLLPNIDYPYIYANDAYSHSWLIQRVMEGWFFDNLRSGFPFGSNSLDFPGSDTGNMLVLKLIALVTGNFYSALNFYFLFSFPVIFIISFLVLRSFSISPALSFSGAFLFNFAPFHFQRFMLGHLFYTWYFMVPIFYYLALKIFHFNPGSKRKINLLEKLFYIFCFIALGSFGVYYAFFGLIMISVAALASCRLSAMKFALFPIFFIVLGICMNLLPNILYKYEMGENVEVAHRMPVEADLYALKLVPLLLPTVNHHNAVLRKMTDRYNAMFSNFPQLNAGIISPLGILGSLGFVGLFFVIFFALSGKKQNENLTFIALLVFILFMFGTIGGLGSVFALLISPSIRAWGRISIFINFGVLFGLYLFMQLQLKKHFSGKKYAYMVNILAVFLLLFGIYDQTVSVSPEYTESTKKTFLMDKGFISSIEHLLPKDSAIYQLPYVRYPEAAPVHHLNFYIPMVGFLHSVNLSWSYGGMAGREGDLFYRSLAEESITHQLEEIKRLGFRGVYIDRRGFEDNGNSVIEGWSKALKAKPDLVRADGQVVFFRITP